MHETDPVRSSGWSVALQVLVSIVIAFVLIAGPQVETLWGRVRERLVEFNKPRPAAERPQAVERSPAESKKPQQPVVPVSVAPQRPPVPVTAVSPVPIQPVAPASPAQVQPRPSASPRTLAKEKAKPVVVARRPFAPVLTEPKTDPRPMFAALMQEGYELYRAGWFGPAMGRFKAASQIMPSSVTAHLWTGRAGLKAGRAAEARRALEQVIVLAPASEAAREARTLLGAE